MPTAPAVIGVIDDAQPVVGLVDHLGFTNDASSTLRVSIEGAGAAVGSTLAVRHFNSGVALATPLILTADDLSRGYVDIAMPATPSEYPLAAVLDGVRSDLFVYRVATATPATPYITALFEDPAGPWVVLDGQTKDTTPIAMVFMPGISDLESGSVGHPPYGDPRAIVWGRIELFADGVLAGTGTIGQLGQIQFVLDPLVPGDYDLTVRAVDRAGNASAPSAPIALTILPDAPPPATGEPAIHLAGPAATAEGNSGLTAFTFTLTRTGDLSAGAMVDYFVWGDTDNADFSGGTAGTARFAAGEALKTVTINVVGDTVVEGNETFNLGLANARGGVIEGPSSAGATIIDDETADPPPPPPPPPPPGDTLVGVTSAVESGDGAMLTFTVSRVGDASGLSIVDWFVWGETDEADLTGPTAGSVHFFSGETSHTITLKAAPDGVSEGPEVFTLQLSNARGAGISHSSYVTGLGADDLFV